MSEPLPDDARAPGQLNDDETLRCGIGIGSQPIDGGRVDRPWYQANSGARIHVDHRASRLIRCEQNQRFARGVALHGARDRRQILPGIDLAVHL